MEKLIIEEHLFLNHICSYLNIKDLLNLTSTCKSIYFLINECSWFWKELLMNELNDKLLFSFVNDDILFEFKKLKNIVRVDNTTLQQQTTNGDDNRVDKSVDSNKSSDCTQLMLYLEKEDGDEECDEEELSQLYKKYYIHTLQFKFASHLHDFKNKSYVKFTNNNHTAFNLNTIYTRNQLSRHVRQQQQNTTNNNNAAVNTTTRHFRHLHLHNNDNNYYNNNNTTNFNTNMESSYTIQNNFLPSFGDSTHAQWETLRTVQPICKLKISEDLQNVEIQNYAFGFEVYFNQMNVTEEFTGGNYWISIIGIQDEAFPYSKEGKLDSFIGFWLSRYTVDSKLGMGLITNTLQFILNGATFGNVLTPPEMKKSNPTYNFTNNNHDNNTNNTKRHPMEKNRLGVRIGTIPANNTKNTNLNQKLEIEFYFNRRPIRIDNSQNSNTEIGMNTIGLHQLDIKTILNDVGVHRLPKDYEIKLYPCISIINGQECSLTYWNGIGIDKNNLFIGWEQLNSKNSSNSNA